MSSPGAEGPQRENGRKGAFCARSSSLPPRQYFNMGQNSRAGHQALLESLTPEYQFYDEFFVFFDVNFEVVEQLHVLRRPSLPPFSPRHVFVSFCK